jgi:hypothetical protein
MISYYGKDVEAARDGGPNFLIFLVGRASVPAALEFSCLVVSAAHGGSLRMETWGTRELPIS